MNIRVVVLILGLSGALAESAIAAQHAGAAAVSAAQVADCRQAQPVVTELLNAALKRLEEARLTNNAAAIRDAADDVQAALVDIRTQLAPCTVMQAVIDPHAVKATPAAPVSSVAPAEPPAAADAHGGHPTPGAPQTPASRAAAAVPARPATSPRAVAPAHDAHAEPVTPAAPAKEAPPAAATRPSPAAPPTNIGVLKCSNPIDLRTAPRMLYQGRMYYFCTEASRAEFAKDPGEVVTAPPQAAPAHAH